MNLAQTIAVQAGGPGSGRRPWKRMSEEERHRVAREDPRQKSLFGPRHEKEILQPKKEAPALSTTRPDPEMLKPWGGIFEKKVKAYGTPEGAKKGWDTRGRGRAEGKTYLHKGFHETLTKLGYQHQDTTFEKKAAIPESLYYHPKSNRAVRVSEGGQWDTHKGPWGVREQGDTPGQFFEKYHMKKKTLDAVNEGSEPPPGGVYQHSRGNDDKFFPKVRAGGPGSGRHPEGSLAPFKPPKWGSHALSNDTAKDYKTHERGVRYRLAWHDARMQELMKQGMGRDAASSQAMKDMSEAARQGRKKKLEALGEPDIPSFTQGYMEPKLIFHPPSLRNPQRVPTDDPGETDNRFLDVDKRKAAQKDRLNMLKRSAPGGLPALIPVTTTAVPMHSGVYFPSVVGSRQRVSQRPARMMGAKVTSVRLRK